MGFRRLFGIGDPDAEMEVDTQILGPFRPGADLTGEVLLKGGSRDTYVQYVYLEVKVRCLSYDGERDYQFESSTGDASSFTLGQGEEKRVTFKERLSWETPVSELSGRALGVVLSVKTRLHRDYGSDGALVDDDLLHVSALPLHEAVMDAFLEEGYDCDTSFVLDSYIPGAERHSGFYQVFVLTDRAPGPGRPEQLEVVFDTNAVGATVYVRRAALHERDWDRKPPVRRFPAAHHEVGHVDLRLRVGKVLAELVLLGDG